MNTYKIVTSTITFDIKAVDSDFACWSANDYLKERGFPIESQRAELILVTTDHTGAVQEESLGEFSLEGVPVPTAWGDIKQLRSALFAEAKKDASNNWDLPVIRSRGAVLTAEDNEGKTLLSSGECWDMPHTLKKFKASLVAIKNQFPTAAKVFICIGCDSAESVMAFTDNDYTPWSGEASALIHVF